MPNISPNGKLHLLGGVPLDNTYNHTLYFGTEAEQEQYFIGKSRYEWTDLTYTRKTWNQVKVEASADVIRSCNYLMFRNTSFTNKWFYAFVTDVEYVNNVTALITFEIDVMQTWYFDYILKQCYVEREHSVTDNIGDNTVPETNMPIKPYVCNDKNVEYFTDMNLLVYWRPNDVVHGTYRQGIYTPLSVNLNLPLNSTTIGIADDFFQQFASTPEQIIACYEVPSIMLNQETQTTTVPRNTTIDGYTPKNNKMFTYPYNYLVMTNNCGEHAEYRWELFGGTSGNVTFDIKSVYMTGPCMLCYPQNYAGDIRAFEKGLTYSNFPTIPWTGDVYQMYLARNKGNIASSLQSTALGGIASTLATGNPMGLVGSGVNLLQQAIGNQGKEQDLKATPDSIYGQVQCDSFNVAEGRVGFTFYSMSITAERAKQWDDFWTMFGYPVNSVKKPNISARPAFNYVKTLGCVIDSDAPAADTNRICQIFDNGITFWKNKDVGNYGLNNSPA